MSAARSILHGAVIAGACVAAAPASAQPVAVGTPPTGGTLVTFNALTAGTPVTTQFAALGVVISGGACANPDVSASFGGDPMQVANYVGGGPETPGISCTPAGPVAQPITFTFAQPITSFGVNATSNTGIRFRFTTDNGSVDFGPTPAVGALFRGIQDARAFSTVTISAADRPSFYLVFDDLRFAPAPTAVVPEPATWALVGAGLLGVGGMWRRRGARTA